jgi:ubiquitin carboxyl-terminal hydrolase 9/24
LQDYIKNTGETNVEDPILEGHLGVTKELLSFQSPEKKYHIGCKTGGANLVKVSFFTFVTVSAGMCILKYMSSFLLI